MLEGTVSHVAAPFTMLEKRECATSQAHRERNESETNNKLYNYLQYLLTTNNTSPLQGKERFLK